MKIELTILEELQKQVSSLISSLEEAKKLHMAPDFLSYMLPSNNNNLEAQNRKLNQKIIVYEEALIHACSTLERMVKLLKKYKERQ